MKRYGLVIVLAACNGPADHKLPSATLAPALQRPAPTACGIDIAFGDRTSIDLRYRYAFDEYGRVARGIGVYTGADIDDVFEYEWDNLDHMVHMLHTQNGASAEITAHYNTLGDLLAYTQVETEGGRSQTSRYTFEAFSEMGLATRQLASQGGVTYTYELTYDSSGRLLLVTPDHDQPPTIYTYDDDAKTTTIDTGNGAYHGVQIHDERNHIVSETWGGTGPGVLASEQHYVWSGDRLETVTYRSGTSEAPTELRTVQVETYRYECSR